MIVVATRLGDSTDDTSHTLAVFGRELIGDDAELLDRLEPQVDLGHAVLIPRVVEAVELIGGIAGIGAVDILAFRAQYGGAGNVLGDIGDACGQDDEVEVVTRFQGKLIDLALIDRQSDLRLAGVDEGRLAGNRHRFLHRPKAKCDV